MRKRMLTVMGMVLALGISFALGRLSAGRQAAAEEQERLPVVFYAEIVEIRDTSMLVEGLSVNDVNGRGIYRIGLVRDEFRVVWHNVEMSTADLKVGQRIAVYRGPGVEESAPAGIVDVLRINILDDVLDDE